MNILPKVVFTNDFRCYKKGDEISLNESLTVITGDNGSGKSTLLSAIRKIFETKWSFSDELEAVDKIEANVPKNIRIGYLDLSLDLHKTSPEINFDNMQTYMQCLNSSSGEGVFLQMVEFLNEHTDLPLVILDEPERGLSIRLQLIMTKFIRQHRAKHPNQQIIITTHSRVFMNLSKEVYSTSHRDYIDPNEYIKWCFESAGFPT